MSHFEENYLNKIHVFFDTNFISYALDQALSEDRDAPFLPALFKANSLGYSAIMQMSYYELIWGGDGSPFEKRRAFLSLRNYFNSLHGYNPLTDIVNISIFPDDHSIDRPGLDSFDQSTGHIQLVFSEYVDDLFWFFGVRNSKSDDRKSSLNDLRRKMSNFLSFCDNETMNIEKLRDQSLRISAVDMKYSSMLNEAKVAVLFYLNLVIHKIPLVEKKFEKKSLYSGHLIDALHFSFLNYTRQIIVTSDEGFYRRINKILQHTKLMGLELCFGAILYDINRKCYSCDHNLINNFLILKGRDGDVDVLTAARNLNEIFDIGIVV